MTQASTAIRDALAARGVTGKDGAPIEHVEIFAPPQSSDANSRNFVLCPGGAYDRSPCGTGTSAKLACLHADGKLRPGEVWVQESIIGSRFRATFEPGPNGGVLPRIGGTRVRLRRKHAAARTRRTLSGTVSAVSRPESLAASDKSGA